ncbi:MAG: POTRA domain-containing protein [Kofleriaceae bacterium]
MVRGCLIVVVAAACGGAPRTRTPAASGTCAPAIEPAVLAPVTGNIETYAAHRVSTVELTGAPRAVHAKIVAALEVKRDQPLDTRAVRRDLLLLAKLEIADDVTIAAFPDGERVSLRYQLAPRGLLERVEIHGLEHRALRELRGLAGGLDSPRRLAHVTQHVLDQLRRDGYLDATLTVARVARGHVCATGSLGRRYTIARIEITGGGGMNPAELRRRIARRFTVNTIGGTYHAELLTEALVGVRDEYQDRGYFDARIDEPRAQIDRAHARVTLRIAVDQGTRFQLGELTWRGVPIAERGRVVLGLRPHTFYGRRELQAAFTRLRTWAAKQDHAIELESKFHVPLGRLDLVIVVSRIESHDAQ